MLMYNNFKGCQSEVNDMHNKFYFFILSQCMLNEISVLTFP